MGLRAGLGSAENLVPTGIRSPDFPSRSESLYRLSYPGPLSILDRNVLCHFTCFMHKSIPTVILQTFLLRSVSSFQVLEGHACHQSMLLRTVSFQEGCDF